PRINIDISKVSIVFLEKKEMFRQEKIHGKGGGEELKDEDEEVKRERVNKSEVVTWNYNRKYNYFYPSASSVLDDNPEQSINVLLHVFAKEINNRVELAHTLRDKRRNEMLLNDFETPAAAPSIK
ncbi:MAG: hypothetical protein LBB09_02675, partial [Rickettsiales bacterium]|nr:hypothetical protein [Rickettsiales bacterium]